MIGVPAAVAASSTGAPTATPISTVPINGVAKNGKKFTGTYSVQQVVFSGRMAGRRVTRSGVKIPATMTTSSGAQAAQFGRTCSILHLQLAPINLNLRGLQVKLGGGPNANQVITLDITAHQGGGLLGDLLCGLSGVIPPIP